MAQVTMLEAIRDALFEEMAARPYRRYSRRGHRRLIGGAFKVTEGLLREVRARARDRHAHQRERHRRRGLRHELSGAAAGGGNAIHRFHRLLLQSAHQLRGQVALSLRRAGAHGVRGPSGGGVHGGPFHSANPEMYFVHTPGLKVIYPSTAYDAKGLLKSAIRDNNPVLFFEHKFLYRRVKEEFRPGDYTVPIGKAIVRREGRHLTIVSYAAMMHVSLEAAAELAKEGIEAEVIDLRTLLPLDRETILASVKEDQPLAGGARGHAHRRHRRRDCGHRLRRGVRRSRRPIGRVTGLDTGSVFPVPYSLWPPPGLKR
jgi:2-oxoisovalerate dehydrogenase E1 component beta subunit